MTRLREYWWLYRVGRHLRRGRWQATPAMLRTHQAHYRGTGRTTAERMAPMTTQDIRPEYEGWRNYETWAVNLWLANDEGIYNGARDLNLSIRPDDAERELRDYVESVLWGDEAPGGLGTDLIGHALDYVDWAAVVESVRQFEE